jgi:hypothetical protein
MTRARLCALAMLVALAPHDLHAQGVVISGSSSARYIELRPLMLDSTAYANTDSAWGSYRLTNDGILARCTVPTAYCTFFRSANRQSIGAIMQDVDVTAWGLAEGVSAHAQLRARTAVGDGRDLWPQAQQRFDALAAYADLDRPKLRARLGRQWLSSSLGVFNFDGLGFVFRPSSMVTAELYGGGSLVQGLDRALGSDALSPVEDLPPTDRAYLVGGIVRLRPTSSAAFAVQYQREIRRDRAALYSERFAATGDVHLGRAALSGKLSRDLATGAFNELTAAVRAQLLTYASATVTARRYAPYFDLWTIWGAFAPVAFEEFGTDLRWTLRDGAVMLTTSGAWRTYDDVRTGLATLPLRRDGWRAGADLSVRLSPSWVFDGGYRADIGFGATGTNVETALRYEPVERMSLALRGSAYQTIGEFQVGEGRVYGVGGEASLQLTSTVRLVGDAFVYRRDARGQPQLVDWNQRRADVRVEWSLGGEPGWGGSIGKARRDAP